MKNLTKKIMVSIIFSILSLTLIACNNQQSLTESDGVITVLLDNKDRGYYESVIERFETDYADLGYTVNPIWTAGSDVQSNQATKIGSGTPPDVIIGGDTYTEVYSRSLLDLTEYIERDKDTFDVDDYIDGIMERLTNEDGNVVFLPRYFNISLLYFNKDLFDQSKVQLLNANITPAPDGTPDDETHYPHINWTIEDYFTAGGVLTKTGSNGEITQLGSTKVGGWWGEWLIHLLQSGGDIFDEDGYVSFDTDAAKDAFQIWYDKSYGNQTLGRSKISAAPGETDFGGFQGLHVAMEYGGHTANWSRYDSMDTLNWGVTLLPTGLETRSGAEFAIDGVGIYKNSPDKEASWAFIKYLSDKEGIADSVEEGFLTVRKSVFEEMEDGVQKERASLAISAIDPNGEYPNYARTLPKYEYFTDITMNVIEPILQLMLANDSSNISIDEALSRIQKQANDYIILNYK
ncbi:extracellular solute-binding protein [Mycoplasmatota bacterium]|nr:extracellular solute-binding protein [Mycoplasmatota bacterium]